MASSRSQNLTGEAIICLAPRHDGPTSARKNDVPVVVALVAGEESTFIRVAISPGSDLMKNEHD
jgi:hypothetical protein